MPQARNAGIAIGSAGLTFPEPPGYEAKWAPVFIEPIAGSGERLCIGIAAIGDDKQIEATSTLQEDTLDAVFGSHGKAFKKLTDTILQALETHLQAGGTLNNWTPPFEGVEIGTQRPAEAKDIAGILRQGLRRSACLSAWLLDPAAEDKSPEAKDEQEDRLPTQVRELVIKQHPELSGFFNKELRITPKARANQIYFIGRRLAANLDKLIPTGQSLTGCVNRAKVKMLGLNTLKHIEDDMYYRELSRFEMLLLRPSDSDALYTARQIDALHSALLELSKIADCLNVRLHHNTDPNQLAERLIEMEKAA